MFLLEVIDLLALIGLFVQAFVAWIFVAVLASIRSQATSRSGFQSFLLAFVALAVALSVMSIRFFRMHDVPDANEHWDDGSLLPTLVYSVYMGLKGLFGLLLVRGSYQLAGSDVPRWVPALGWPMVAALAFAPVLEPAIGPLLVVQAPILVVFATLAYLALRSAQRAQSGMRLVRGSLLALAVSWGVHAFALLADGRWKLQPLISLNSFIDLVVQLTLGIGLVVCLLQDSHRRLMEAEQERLSLRREVAKDEKLRALGTAVSGVAHELNNPLTVILGYADDLMRSESTRRAATIIVEQAERCHGIVRNLSALAGQSVHPHEDLDLEELAQRVLRGLAPDLTREGRSVRIEPMAGLGCSGDRIGLEQVLTNLVVNALHASPPGGVVTVAAARAGDRGGEFELTVTDEGPGVPAHLRERLFEPFFTTKDPGQGTGLGLAIAHAIVRGHRGTLSVEDEPGGRGARFRVRQPGVIAPLAGTEPAPANGPAERPPASNGLPESETTRAQDNGSPGPGTRLLIVDDDALVRSIVRARAEHRGWRVREVPSAEEALTLPLDDFEAILCDLRMPGMGGLGLHDRLSAERPELLTRVVFVTGDPTANDAGLLAARSARPILGKPFDFPELFSRFSEAASPREPQEPARG